ncbi:MAG TPA: DUF167 domain-containing protein [Acidimicrobiales bacterium]
MSEPYEVRDDGAVVLTVHVQPGAARSGVAGRHGDAVKVRVAAPPEGGRANAAVVELVAAGLGVRRSDVELLAGKTGRRKRLLVRNATPAAVDRWLDGR